MFCYASAVSQISNIKIYTYNCEKIDGVRKKSGENKNARKVCIEILFILIFPHLCTRNTKYKLTILHYPFFLFLSLLLLISTKN